MLINLNVPIAVGDAGKKVALETINALCSRVVAAPLNLKCTGELNGANACGGNGQPSCCTDVVNTTGVTDYTCLTPEGNPQVGFRIIRNPARPNISIGFPSILSTAIGKVDNLNLESNCITINQDLLDPDGVHGIFTFNVRHTQGGTNPRSCSIDTTGLTDQQLHEGIRQCYESLGLLGLRAVIHSSADAPLQSAAPATLPGYFVEVSYPISVTDFEHIPLAGQVLTAEMVANPSPAVPALSGSAIAALVFALMLVGAWMLNRRHGAARQGA